MSYSEVKGDLIAMAKNGDFDIIVHGCNCHCTMGSGIAAQIKHQFHAAYAADLCTTSGVDKRGTFTWAQYPGESLGPQEEEGGLIIVNAYTQFSFGTKQDLFDYIGFRRILRQLKIFAREGAKIGFPQIGAGLAGGDWERIKAIIQEELADCDVTVVIYEQ